MSGSDVLAAIGDDGMATVTLNRPQVHNAFSDAVIAELTRVLRDFGEQERVRAVILRANGKSFSAGADLGWMQRISSYSFEDNVADAMNLAELMRTLDRLPKPTIAAVQGAAFGGGVGLVACCDIAVAADTATFCLSEVKLGLIPAVISPYVVAAIGERAARRYFLTAERFSAVEAHRIGLVHEVVPGQLFDQAVTGMAERLREGGPVAQAAAKDLVFAVARQPLGEAVVKDTARRIAETRASAEGREGLAAFLEKREPAWRSDS